VFLEERLFKGFHLKLVHRPLYSLSDYLNFEIYKTLLIFQTNLASLLSLKSSFDETLLIRQHQKRL